MLERIHLNIVQQVEKQGSLTAAAGVLNLTQSALSHSMKKLEQQLGTDIWLREGRSPAPDAGRPVPAGSGEPRAAATGRWPRSACASLPRASAARCASAWSATPATSGC
jgi:DNA-binding transcriptional ArsR family regulator